MSDWPIVALNDDGIRPAGRDDQCFYCHQMVGQPHGRECVIVEKLVKLRYIFEVELKVPHHWTQEDIEFHRNESNWCASNAIDDIQTLSGGEDGCPCRMFTCEFVAVVDETPTRDLMSEDALKLHALRKNTQQ